MLRTNQDDACFDVLATGVARLDAVLRFVAANPAFTEHTGFGWSRLKSQTLVALQPEGKRLHELARRAQEQGSPCAVGGVAVCAAPGHEARLDVTLTPSPGLDPLRRSYASFASFRDPDGNRWYLQEVTHPAHGREPEHLDDRPIATTDPSRSEAPHD